MKVWVLYNQKEGWILDVFDSVNAAREEHERIYRNWLNNGMKGTAPHVALDISEQEVRSIGYAKTRHRA